MNIFLDIIEGKKSAEKVYEDENILAIKDIAPKAPVHILIMPKKHYANLQEVPINELAIISEIIKVAQTLAKEFHVEKGYRLIANIGRDGGQEIDHLHFHLIGGKKLGSMA